jgi:uncharacterized membrane protein
METRSQTSKEYFKALMIIFVALISGQVMFGLVAFFLNLASDFSQGFQDLGRILLILVCVFTAGAYLGGRMLFKKRMDAAKKMDSLTDKMTEYRAAVIVRFALLEGPSFFAIVEFSLTGDLVFLIIAGFIIAIFITLAPSRKNAVRDLDLNNHEEQKILDPDAIISEIKTGN